MPEPTKKRHTDRGAVRLRVTHHKNVPRIEEYASIIEPEEGRNDSVAGVIPEYVGKEQLIKSVCKVFIN